jgi:hypothetical protein
MLQDVRKNAVACCCMQAAEVIVFVISYLKATAPLVFSIAMEVLSKIMEALGQAFS